MTRLWGIHNDEFPASKLVAEGFVSIGWERVPDLATIGNDQDAIRAVLQSAYPDAKPGAIPIWAGVLRRFAFVMEVGDYVVAPDRDARAVNIGRVTGRYRYVGSDDAHPHRRDVEWMVTGLPRTSFSATALNEIGSAMTLFEVRSHTEEFLAALRNAGHQVEFDGATPGVVDGLSALHTLGEEYLRAMRSGDSVLTPGRAVWTLDAARELQTSFVDRPDVSGRTFDAKLDDQLDGASDNALQLFAELWLMSLAPLADYKPTKKRQLVRRVLDKMDQPAEMPPSVESALNASAFSGGVAFKTRRPFQLALLVRLAVSVLSLVDRERIDALAGPREFAALLDTIAEPREPAQRRAVRWLLFPDYYLPIVSERHRNAIRDAFAELLDGSAADTDAELHQIRSSLSGADSETPNFYAPPLIDRWDPERKLSGVPIAADQVHRRSEFKTPRYALATEAIQLVGEGHWTTYSDVAEAVGLTPGQVGQYINEVEHAAGHRVIKLDGTTYPEFNGLPDNVTPQQALEAEGVEFDATGVADASRKITREDLREQLDQRGLLPHVSKRAWLVRGSNVGGRDLVPRWRDKHYVSLPATNLREVEPGASRDQLKLAVEEDYAHASYAARAEKVDEFHAFLTRMEIGDLVATVDQGRLYLGRIAGGAELRASTASDSNLVRPADWGSSDGVDYSNIPSEVAARLRVQRDVLDLTQHLDVLEKLLQSEETHAPLPVVHEVRLGAPSDELAHNLHVDKSWLQECIDLLNDRPQLIFYGPPGTGKTYIAQALAKFTGGENVQLVQFHPAYSYEDFLEGYRPTAKGGFELRSGPMRRIADKAVENPAVPHFLIIDEINRGNLAKVFGELYFLLEYRDESVRLLYSEEDFNLPKNVYIIGTMNTADRSIALVDAAMRRRFAFLPLHPAEPPTNGVLRSWLRRREEPERIADLLEELNERIEDPDFKIGPSYFMRDAVFADGGLERVWRTSILPLLEEHHYGDLSGAQVRSRYGLDVIASRVDRRVEAATDADAATD